jgi:hypothetical protein
LDKFVNKEVDFKRNNGYNTIKEVCIMKKLKTIPILVMLLSILFSFNIFAMKYNDYEYVPPMPSTEKKYDDRNLNSRWTWLNNELCVRFQGDESIRLEKLERLYDSGLMSRWVDKIDGEWQVVKRGTYSGKWFQSANGIWSFEFDDKTIPIGVTKIDGVLYAFNAFGELKDEYKYYDELKTGADGLVKADSTDFMNWLSTQYLPECTSHE